MDKIWNFAKHAPLHFYVLYFLKKTSWKYKDYKSEEKSLKYYKEHRMIEIYPKPRYSKIENWISE